MQNDLEKHCAAAVYQRRQLGSWIDADLARVVLAIARPAILEEAAKVADEHLFGDEAADGIRSLANTTGQEG